MGVLLTGMMLGLAVSVPPGPNTVLCMNLASAGGIRRAMPLITTAALTDAAYSLLAASGLLLASHAGTATLSVLAPCFMIVAAVLAWPSTRAPSAAAAGTALFNPGTAAIWLSLSSLPALHIFSVGDVLVRTLPVAAGTAAWFTLLAMAASRLANRIGARSMLTMQRMLSAALAVGGAISLIVLFS